jgi:hypothetical protein
VFKDGRIRRPTHATVVSYLALFVALATGSAWAAATIGAGDIKDNAIRSRHIKDGQVLRHDVADGAVSNPKLGSDSVTTDKVLDESLTGADVSDNSLTGDDIAEDSLGQVPSAVHADAADSATNATNATNATTANDAGNLDGLDSSAFARSEIYVLTKITDGSANVNGTCPSGAVCFAGGYYCDPGDTMLSGGFAEIDNGTHLVASEPFVPNSEDTWRIKFINDSTEDTITVYTICADNGAAHT